MYVWNVWKSTSKKWLVDAFEWNEETSNFMEDFVNKYNSEKTLDLSSKLT